MSHQHTLNVQSSPDITLRIVTSVELTSYDDRVLTEATAVDIAKAIPPGSLIIGFNPVNLLKKSEIRPTTTPAATRAAANTHAVAPNPRSPPPVQYWVFPFPPDLQGRGSAKWKIFLSDSTRSIRIIESYEIGHAVISDLSLHFGVLILKRGVMVKPGTNPNAKEGWIQKRNAVMSQALEKAKLTADRVSGAVRMEKFLEFALLELARAEMIGLPWKNVGSGPYADWVANPAPLLDETNLLRKYVEEKGNAMRAAWNVW
jgi:hypothetical protein